MKDSKVIPIINKAYKVISSCENIEQLNVAENYVDRVAVVLKNMVNPISIMDLEGSLKFKRLWLQRDDITFNIPFLDLLDKPSTGKYRNLKWS